jgi:pimeloyl-ACP methyl ester carboxylesterase
MKKAMTFAGIALLVYSALCAGLYFWQGSLLYHPTPDHAAARAEILRIDTDGASLKVWHVARPGERAVIYFGGNADDAAAFIDDLAELLPDDNVYLVNYRGYGGSTGVPSEKALLSDAEAVFDDVAKRQTRVDVIGRSLGSGVAVHLATVRPVHKLVLVTPYDSILSVAQRHFSLFPVAWLLNDTFDSARWAPRVTAPVLVLTAKHDRLIPREHSERLVAHLPPELVTTVEIGDANHDSVVQRPTYRHALALFLRD